jgi:hypothetical protein
MFLEKQLFEYVLVELADEVATHESPVPEPMACDRWIARSALQKSCRRGDVKIAQIALARLFVDDPQSVWRHLTVIALEDVGVANIELVRRVQAARLNRQWRKKMGGDWAVASLLVTQIAESDHCQAACDLLLVSLNRPVFEAQRDLALHSTRDRLIDTITDSNSVVEHQAIAALALGGGLADGQTWHDPHAVFDVLAEQQCDSHVVATCRAAWRGSRNPMAMLLPLVWELWKQDCDHTIADDPIRSARMLNGVPDYAIDQFTRTGGQVARALLTADQALRSILENSGVAKHAQPRVVGDLQFLLEGSCLKNRIIWQAAENLRLPHRSLPGIFRVGDNLEALLVSMAAGQKLFLKLRVSHFVPCS